MQLTDKQMGVLRRRMAKIADNHHGHGCLGEMNARAVLVVERMHANYTGVEDAALSAFASSITDLMIEMLDQPTSTLADSLELTFDIYTMAAAQLVGIYDPAKGLEGMDPAEFAQPQQSQPATHTGMYL